MWALYLDGDCVLASEDRDILIEYLAAYQPGTYRAEVDHVDPRLVAFLTPAQALVDSAP